MPFLRLDYVTVILPQVTFCAQIRGSIPFFPKKIDTIFIPREMPNIILPVQDIVSLAGEVVDVQITIGRASLSQSALAPGLCCSSNIFFLQSSLQPLFRHPRIFCGNFIGSHDLLWGYKVIEALGKQLVDATDAETWVPQVSPNTCSPSVVDLLIYSVDIMVRRYRMDNDHFRIFTNVAEYQNVKRRYSVTQIHTYRE